MLPHVRRELLNYPIEIKTEFRACDDLLEHRDHFRADPYLFLVHMENMGAVQELKRLSGAFVDRPILALLETGKSPEGLIAAMRAGAVQGVPLPLDPLDFRAALDCIGLQYGKSASLSQLLVISGVTGGCVATTLASNLAYDLAHL
jgi:hypothetical protein